MQARSYKLARTCVLVLSSLGLACSSASSAGGSGGSSSPSASGGSAGAPGSSATGGHTGSGGTGQGGTSGLGGSPTGGASTPSSTGQGGQTSVGSGGASVVGGQTSTGTTSTGGGVGKSTTATGGAGGATSSGTAIDGGTTDNGGCVPTKTWGTVDPSKPGPFEVATDKNVGPENGVPDKIWNNQLPHFNVYYPKDLSQGYCHPLITWGNGTGDQPEPVEPNCMPGQCGYYKTIITQIASHGFVVVASLSSQTLQGDPLPQIAGVNWMIQENSNPASKFYHKLDISKIGATGHSQGGAATSVSATDPRIVASTPICGARAGTMHGPVLLLCGGADTTVPCSKVQPAFDGISGVPVMMAELAGMTHGSWIGSIQDPVMVGTVGWMRVHLMNDTANRSMFYGPSCKVCSDSKWKIQRKGMDQ
jgi:hypothetical protein